MSRWLEVTQELVKCPRRVLKSLQRRALSVDSGIRGVEALSNVPVRHTSTSSMKDKPKARQSLDLTSVLRGESMPERGRLPRCHGSLGWNSASVTI